jgi:hypothetical protein
MTPLFKLVHRFLPAPLAVIAVGICYGIVAAATIYCLGRPPIPFIYL